MYPITHIWFAEKVLGYRNSSLILGAIFPDIAVTRCLSYLDTHYCGWKLYNHMKQYDSDFAKAMITHTVNPMGLDYYGDESYKSGYKGYCFQKAKEIAEEVIKACNIPENFGLWKAHNFIEMGIELNVIDADLSLHQDLYKVSQNKSVIDCIAKPVEDYYSLKSGQISESFKRYAEYIELEQPNSSTLAVKYDMQMQSKHGININIEESARIIQSCREIVREDIDEFMDYCTANIRVLVEGGDKSEPK
ncbi:MAG: hypothetical protein K0R84_1710 [Clostridia bacterium]|jgi:hypothetical protein|nr:hypothetical protein [Clostridia bacterium]